MEDMMLQLGAAVTSGAGDAWVIVGNFLVLIVLTFLVFMFAMRRGGAGIISLNLALYAGYAIYTVFPYRDSIVAIGSTPILQAIISLILFVLATAGPFIIIIR